MSDKRYSFCREIIINLKNMEKRNELGTVRTAEELIRMTRLNGSGEIIVEGVIDMADTPVFLSEGQVLRGKDEKCGLSFNFSDGDVWPLTLSRMCRLENIVIEVKEEAVFGENCLGAVLVDGQLVRLKNVFIRVISEFENQVFSALYLCHRVEAEGYLLIDVNGKSAAALGGNDTAPAILRMCPGSNLKMWIYQSRSPVVFRCVLELDNAEMEYSNYSEDFPREDFGGGYVFFIGQCRRGGTRADKMVLTKELGYNSRYRAEIFNPAVEKDVSQSRPWWKVLLGVK